MIKNLDISTQEESWKWKVNMVIAFLISIEESAGIFYFILGGGSWSSR